MSEKTGSSVFSVPVSFPKRGREVTKSAKDHEEHEDKDKKKEEIQGQPSLEGRQSKIFQWLVLF